MNIPYFTKDGIFFLLRWMHIYAGIIWIGHLYYFNFVQGSFMKEAAAPAKPEVLGKLLPRALWWFRWGAFWTIVTGAILIGAYAHELQGFNNSWGVLIGTGGVMGVIMAANVWFVIWPAQKIVIASSAQTAAGGQAIAGAAEAGAKALLASRTNTLLSVPLLFFMAAARHLVLPVTETSNYGAYWAVAFAAIVLIEANALFGKLGPIETVKGVITGGFIITAFFAVAMGVIL